MTPRDEASDRAVKEPDTVTEIRAWLKEHDRIAALPFYEADGTKNPVARTTHETHKIRALIAEIDRLAAEGLVSSPAHRDGMTLEQLLVEWDKEVGEHGIWTSGHSIAERIVKRLRAEVSSPARPQLERLVKRWRGDADASEQSATAQSSMFFQGEETGYAAAYRECANELEAVLAEGAVSAAPQIHSLSCPANGQNLGGYRCECGEVSSARPAPYKNLHCNIDHPGSSCNIACGEY